MSQAGGMIGPFRGAGVPRWEFAGRVGGSSGKALVQSQSPAEGLFARQRQEIIDTLVLERVFSGEKAGFKHDRKGDPL